MKPCISFDPNSSEWVLYYLDEDLGTYEVAFPDWRAAINYLRDAYSMQWVVS